MRILIFFLFLTGIRYASLADEREQVLGVWLIENKEAKVELYLNNQGQLEGRLVWLKEQYDEAGRPRTDIHNDDPGLRNRPILGMVLASGFEWNPQTREWQNGNVYVPGNGNTYCGAIKLKADGTLHLRGYICGLRFLGKTSYCTRSALDRT